MILVGAAAGLVVCVCVRVCVCVCVCDGDCQLRCPSAIIAIVRHRIASLSLLIVLEAACAPRATPARGYFVLGAHQHERAVEQIAPRAVRELRCPEQQLEWLVLRVTASEHGDLPTKYCVAGCGRARYYVRAFGSWELEAAPFPAECPHFQGPR